MQLYIFFLFLFCLNFKKSKTLSSAHIISNKKNVNTETFSSHFPPNTFHGVSNAVACDDKLRCLKIIEFSISPNHSLNCFDKYLPIIFGDSQIGFYPRDGGILFYHQKNSETCQKIKR